ncbi:MAG: sulfur carrier protein ThiS adenylyltransferase ThiF [Lachnospiraceae bacterium]|nr:sulfur carrier protein ThiS adenylyltransferase ThiF [Lachnospiraceae bacterium]
MDNEELKIKMIKSLEERVGPDIQKKFLNARVAICGLGGLGSNVAISLARAGVGYLHIIDFDEVDISNLNRQQYFPEQLGMKKTEALSDTLRRIAPYTTVKAECVKINDENAAILLKDVDIICEAFDDAVNKAMLVEQVLVHFPEKYIVSGSGMAGFGSANLIKTTRRLGKLYVCGDNESDVNDDIGLISSRVMACAAHEANMILRLILGETEC